MPSLDLSQIIMDVRGRVTSADRKPFKTAAVAIFDLADSVRMKLQEGHTHGSRQALGFSLLCERVTVAFGGRLVKLLGDGALAVFPNSAYACRAAVEIKGGAGKLSGLTARAALTFGYVEEVEVGGTIDVYGDTVDRCARLLALAGPGQLLIDEVLHQTAHSVLIDDPDVLIGKAWRVVLKGAGPTVVHELSTKAWGLGPTPKLERDAQIHEQGRLSLDDKVAFIDGAQTEILEIGLGLTTLADYFVSRRPAEFTDHIVAALRRGVRLRCVVLDPVWEGTGLYLTDNGEPHYGEEITASIAKFRKVIARLPSGPGWGSFEVHVYRHMPCFHASVVDVQDSRRGRMTITNYLPGIPRSHLPVVQFSRLSSPAMFATYWRSIQALLRDSDRVC